MPQFAIYIIRSTMFWNAAVFALMAALPIVADAQSAASPSAEEPELIALTDEWANAEIKHDEAMLNRIVDDRFLFIPSSGKAIDGKAAYIEAVRKFTLTSVTVADGSFARVFGETAIVVGVFTPHRAGGPDGAPQRATITYVKRDGQWKAVAEVLASVPPAK